MANDWTKEQQAAIDEKDANILVSASAGSGKTAVLVERVVKKVINDKVDIDKILVVTFTNASAVELKERLLVAIYEALGKNPHNIFLKKQLKYINRASITTIHSFCLELIRQNFYNLSLDPNIKICDDSKSNILKAKAIETVLEKRYIGENEKDEITLYDIFRIFSGKEEIFVSKMLSMYSFIQSFSYPFEWLYDSIQSYNIYSSNGNVVEDICNFEFGKKIYDDTVEKLDVIAKRLQEFRDEISGMEDFEKYIEMLDIDIEKLRFAINSNNSWDTLYDNLQFTFERAKPYKGGNVILKDKIINYRNEVAKKSLIKIKECVYAKSDEILKDNQEAYKYVKYIYDFLYDFDTEYKSLKQEQNVIDFSDIEHFALELLVKKDENGNTMLTDIAKNVQEKFVEVYTDEYQDTSFIQEAILEAVSGSKNRFMVGDIKQSIYKFRQAMPEIFNEKYERYNLYKDETVYKNSLGYDCKKIILAKNFRSRENVIESINYIFKRIMSKANGDCEYTDIEELKFGAEYYKTYDNQNYKTEVNIVNLNKDKEVTTYDSNSNEDNDNNTDSVIEELQNFEVEALCVAKKIKEIVGNFKVYDTTSKEFREAQYKDIVILLRGIKDKGVILENTLKDYDIPAFSDASTSLFESDEIRLILAFLRVIDNPLQDVYMISVMYSIVGKFTLSELAMIRNLRTKQNIYYNIKDKIAEFSEKQNSGNELELNEKILFNKLKKFDSLLTEYIEYSKVYKVSQILSKLYKDTNIYYAFGLTNNASIKKANLDLLLEYAINLEQDMLSSIGSYISYIDNVLSNAKDSSSSAKVIGENEDVVRIMTIHKSKGLEFPIVILCDTSKEYNMQDASQSITLHHNLGVGINIVNENYGITYSSSIKQAIKTATISESKSEELRMLYVALTRAKEKLIIFATVNNFDKFDDSTFVMYKDGAIEKSLISRNNNYFSNIYMCLKDYSDKENIFDVNILNPSEIISTLDDSQTENININKKILELKDCKDYSLKNVEENISKFRTKFDYKYKYFDDVIANTRVSVSELKAKSMEEIQDEEFVKDIELIHKFNIPDCVNTENVRYSAVRKGTLVHFVLEHLDLKNLITKNDVKSYIDSLVTDGVLSIEDRKYISVNSIFNFLNSNIGRQLKDARDIYREEEFILSDKNISNSVIQGVIDLYYINSSDEVVLVDFKTDKLSDETEFITRYKKQLDIYKEAIEKLTKKSVKNVYIYSFNLDKEIEIVY